MRNQDKFDANNHKILLLKKKKQFTHQVHLSKLELNEDPKQEIAIEQLKCNKVTDANSIAPDIWKQGVPP